MDILLFPNNVESSTVQVECRKSIVLRVHFCFFVKSYQREKTYFKQTPGELLNFLSYKISQPQLLKVSDLNLLSKSAEESVYQCYTLKIAYVKEYKVSLLQARLLSTNPSSSTDPLLFCNFF